MGLPSASKNTAVRVTESTMVILEGGLISPMPRIGVPKTTVASLLPAKGTLGLVPATVSFAAAMGDLEVQCGSPMSWSLGVMMGLALMSPLLGETRTLMSVGGGASAM